MKISFKHSSNLYLNCNCTSSVYRCNNVNVSYQQPTSASLQNQQLPTVMHVESYQNSLLSFRSRSFSSHRPQWNLLYYKRTHWWTIYFFK